MNNFERIKQMSVVELCEILKGGGCKCCIYSETECGNIADADCSSSILQWLSEEERMSDKEFYTRLKRILEDSTDVFVKNGAMRELNQIENEIDKRIEESEGK